MAKTRPTDAPDINGGVNSAPVAAAQLRSYIERVERLEEEKAAVATDIKEVYAEAKAFGFDSKIMRKIVARRKRDAAELAEEEAILDTYEHALGMHPDVPDEDE